MGDGVGVGVGVTQGPVCAVHPLPVAPEGFNSIIVFGAIHGLPEVFVIAL